MWGTCSSAPAQGGGGTLWRALLLLAAAAGSCWAGTAAAAPSPPPPPPMGWMSWERFRCGVRHSEAETAAISADLYLNQADKLVKHGLVELGYARVHVDDCWQASERDGAGHLQANATRVPEGIAGLAAKLGEKGVGLGLYTDEGTATCGGYPGSKGTEALDAQTMAAWNVSYLKVDGCENDASDYARGYAAFGEALSSEGLVFSCSWPAYLGDDEAAKPYEAMVAAGCSLWRNWKDIQCSWDSMIEVVNHFGDYSKVLSAAAPPGVYNDPDMLLVGNPCVTLGEGRLQMAVWSILGAPLVRRASDCGDARRACRLTAPFPCLTVVLVCRRSWATISRTSARRPWTSSGTRRSSR